MRNIEAETENPRRAKLNKRTITDLTPEAKRYSVADTNLAGFELRVAPSGIMTFAVRYRDKAGKLTRYTIGRYGPTLSADGARTLAKKRLAEAIQAEPGEDPQSKKKQARQESQVPTLLEFLDGDYGDHARAHYRDGAATLARLRTCFKKDFGNLRLDELTAWNLEKWRSRRLKAGRKPATVNRDIVALKSLCSKAMEWGTLAGNPLRTVKPTKVDNQGSVRYLEADEETRLRDALEARDRRKREGRSSGNAWRKVRGYKPLPAITGAYADYLTPMVLMALNTGARRGELFNLRWEDVDLIRRNLTLVGIGTKAGKTRHIPLNDEALMALRRWRKGSTGTGLVFSGKDGARLNNVKSSWARVLKDAGISRFRWHDMRHHFASRLVMAGVDLNTVRELLGHADIKMTLRYAHLAPEHKAEAVAKLMNR